MNRAGGAAEDGGGENVTDPSNLGEQGALEGLPRGGVLGQQLLSGASGSSSQLVVALLGNLPTVPVNT